jgi:hypothetical protein
MVSKWWNRSMWRSPGDLEGIYRSQTCLTHKGLPGDMTSLVSLCPFCSIKRRVLLMSQPVGDTTVLTWQDIVGWLPVSGEWEGAPAVLKHQYPRHRDPAMVDSWTLRSTWKRHRRSLFCSAALYRQAYWVGLFLSLRSFQGTYPVLQFQSPNW